MTPTRRGPGTPDPGHRARTSTKEVRPDHIPAGTTSLVASQQVNWWSVHEYVSSRWLDQVDGWPLAGTAAWQQLDDADPSKVAALYDAARRWALYADTWQGELAAASRSIEASSDWAEFARQTRQRSGVYIRRSAS